MDLYIYYLTGFIMIPVVIFAFICQIKVNSNYKKYSKIRNARNMTGAQAAYELLQLNGVTDVRIKRIAGNLTDHYNPGNKTLGLSDTVYQSSSVAAVGVAAHECGHAVQHAMGYAPLSIRGALVPVANFGSAVAWPLILIGLLINGETSLLLINLGILLFSAAVLFQLVTLPVEFNASRRAVKTLGASGMLYPDEVASVKKVLGAAALTYVAGAASAILQLLRLLILTGGRRRND